MAGTAFLRYSHRVATQRTGGRYDLKELWQVPSIENVWGGSDKPNIAWQNEVLSADGLPTLGDTNSGTGTDSGPGGYVCTSIVAHSTEDQGTADVEVTYIEDPLTLVTEVNFFGQSKTKPAWQGIAQQYGGPSNSPAPDTPPQPGTDDLYDDDSIYDIRNSAGDRYNPPVTYEWPLCRIEITTRCSFSWFDTGIDAGNDSPGTDFTGNWDDYIGHWNKTDYTVTSTDPDNPDRTSDKTFPAGTLLMLPYRAPLAKEPYFHRLLTLVLLYDPDMWCSRLPDMGPRAKKYLATKNGQVVQIEPPGYPTSLVAVTDTLGRPFGGAAELDGSGNQAIPDNAGKMPPANIFMWWPVDEDGNLRSAEFDDLDIFTPERTLDV